MDEELLHSRTLLSHFFFFFSSLPYTFDPLIHALLYLTHIFIHFILSTLLIEIAALNVRHFLQYVNKHRRCVY